MPRLARRALWGSFVMAALSISMIGCGDDPPPDFTAFDEKVEREQANQCKKDGDCLVTGCHRSLCRTAEDTRFCNHQLVLTRLDVPSPSADVRLEQSARVIAQQHLLGDEAETLQVIVSPTQVFVFFHTSPGRRALIEARFSALRAGGVYAWHREAHAVAQRAREGLLGEDARGMTVRRARGGPDLLEVPVENGDVIAARRRLNIVLAPLLPSGALLAYELLPITPPVLRAWIVDEHRRVDLRQLAALDVEPHPHDHKVTRVVGRLTPEEAPKLATLSRAWDQRPVLVLSGDEVLVAPIISAPQLGGRFELSFRDHDRLAKSVAERIEQIRVTPDLARLITLDHEETMRLSARLECYQKQPPLTTCGCVEGRCAWKDPAALDSCLAM